MVINNFSSVSNHLSDGLNYWKYMLQLSDRYYSNKNDKILWYKEVAWLIRSVLCLLKIVIVLIKEWIKVNSSYNFRTIDLGLFLEASSACTINGTFSSSL